ncbi:MAG: 3-oxocholest-4-en-26-oate---CoA ligase [Nocardioidaceae bacterium]|nr:3-oxocholest-4-en-26-oate---CoA ligase [Nocardioidaceae bacterium]
MSPAVPSPPRPLTLADVLEAIADAVPERPALVTMERSYTYAELDERSTRFANHLVTQGVAPGEHVAIHAANCVEWIEAFYGCFKARAVPININYKYLHEELAYVYDNADCVFAVVAAKHVPAVRALDLPKLRGMLTIGEEYEAALAGASTERLGGRTSDDLYVLYTGGTTGQPKGVVWRQADLMVAALNANRFGAPIESVEQLAAEAAANDNPMVLLACGPMMHGGSQWIIGNALISGSTFALYTAPQFEAATLLDLVESSRVVSLTLLGDAMGRPVAEAITAEPDRWDLSGLAAISNGAAPLSEAVREQLRKALPGLFILDSYGASESGTTGQQIDSGDGASSTAPRFGVGADVEVFDVHLKPCPPGVEGMLGRSGAIPLGYYNDPVKTAATFKEIDGVRWSMPGDFARREEDGSVTVLGRGAVCINTGGEKVYPEEIEGILMRHEDVFDVAVVGVPHERWGQQVTALVQLREGSTAGRDELQAHVRSLLANYKVPKEIMFVSAIPRTTVSKVDYSAVAALAGALLA